MKKKTSTRKPKAASHRPAINFLVSASDSPSELFSDIGSTISQRTEGSGPEQRTIRSDEVISEVTGRPLDCETGAALLEHMVLKRRQWFDMQQANSRTKKQYVEPDLPDISKLPPLPDRWCWGTWSQISNWVTYGFTRPMPHVNEGIPIITAKGVKGGRLDLDGAHLTTREAYDKLSDKDRPQPGDILITKDGTIGRAAIVEAMSEFCINQSVAVIWLRSSPMDRKFLLAVIESELTQKPIIEKARGVAIQHLSITDFGKLALPIPPLLEQRRIVAEIEKQFTRLDAGVAALKRVQANLKRYRAAVLKAACEGKLVPTEAELRRTADYADIADKKMRLSAKSAVKSPSFETGEQLLQRILTERRESWQGRGQYKEPEPPADASRGRLPEGWAWATFEQLSERVTVGFVGSMKHEYVDCGVPFLRGQNVRENRFDPEGLLFVSNDFHQQLSKSALRPGDLAVVRSGSVGVTCVIPDSLPESNCSDLVLIQRPLGFISQYGAYYMNSLAKRYVAAGKVGVALTHFNTKSVAALAIPLPPLAEQTRIVAEVERRLSVVDELETVVSANLQRAARLRQSILQKAFTGELV